MSKELEEQLLKHGIKPTAVRLLVFKAMTGQREVVNLADLETELKTVDKSTIFRTLTLFRQQRLIHTVDDGSGSLKYALCDDECECRPEQQHVHFHCTHCERTFCFRDAAVPLITLPNNFSAESINYVIRGICSDCRKFATRLH
jgi:Fur family ferric uptake transcriptional regulator